MTIDAAAQTTAASHGRIPADTFATRLMLARAQAGHISIREAADLCGIGRGAWTNWEKGAQPESYEDLTDLIAERLNCDRDWLRHGGALRPAEATEGRKPRWRRVASPSTCKPSKADRPMPARPIEGRASSRPADRRPPSGPGRTSRVRHPSDT
jgi:transcriptional regulator with XRE-family HTH domain